MIIRELWSENDRQRCTALQAAARDGDLLAGLLAIDDAAEPGDVEAELRGWAHDVTARLARSSPLDAMRRVLVDDAALTGDDDDYHAPHNSRISAVLARRRGMPILLSAVWIVVGRLAGLDVRGVGMPGHFIVRLDDAAPDDVFVDPFRQGRVLGVDDCRNIVRRLSGGRVRWNDSLLDPVDDRALLVRVLRNFEASLARDDDDAGAYRAARMLGALLPEDPGVALLLGERATKVGAWDEARDVYAETVERSAGSAPAAVALARLSELARATRLRH